MTVKVVIHTATRVIVRMTIEDNHEIDASTETLIDLGVPSFTLPNTSPSGYWKLDLSNQPVPATDQEVDSSRVDPVREALRRRLLIGLINNAIDDIADNGATLVKLRTYFQRLQALR